MKLPSDFDGVACAGGATMQELATWPVGKCIYVGLTAVSASLCVSRRVGTGEGGRGGL